MKRAGYLRVSGIAAVLCMMVIGFLTPATVSAADAKMQAREGKCYIVAIHGKSIAGSQTTPATTQSIIEIQPQYLKIPKGACAVWVNWANRDEISISFKEGKECSSAAEAAMGYRFTPETGCFVTDYLQMGQTSSLRFVQLGKYKYDIFVRNRTAPVASGEIIVE